MLSSPRSRAHERDLVACSRWRGCGCARRARCACVADLAEELLGARQHEARRVGVAQPAVGGAVPALGTARRSRRASARVVSRSPAGTSVAARPSSPCRWSRGCRVARDASKIASVWCTVPMSRIAVVPPSSSSAHGERAPPRTSSRVERGLVGPDHLAQPVEQREVVGAAARERLAGVDVRLHEAGHHDAARGVEDRRSRASAGRAAPPTCDDARRRATRRRRRARGAAASIVRIVPPRKHDLAHRASRSSSAAEAVRQELGERAARGARPRGLPRITRDLRRIGARTRRSTWRHMPHGDAGGDDVGAHRDRLEVARARRAPRAATALRSAHIASAVRRVLDVGAVEDLRRSPCTAAPTWKLRVRRVGALAARARAPLAMQRSSSVTRARSLDAARRGSRRAARSNVVAHARRGLGDLVVRQLLRR